eukprot:TRINITY_DN6979_c0_g1_i3.p1 TRINITY_DN6979_c0_g1~~TRINITY_DN6979_c0_g1_i3.p1  ORF type:complete len:258 (+),score=52.63 TRINITY_DN6979_c0_g1_i3:247-1020(+)
MINIIQEEDFKRFRQEVLSNQRSNEPNELIEFVRQLSEEYIKRELKSQSFMPNFKKVYSAFEVYKNKFAKCLDILGKPINYEHFGAPPSTRTPIPQPPQRPVNPQPTTTEQPTRSTQVSVQAIPADQSRRMIHEPAPAQITPIVAPPQNMVRNRMIPTPFQQLPNQIPPTRQTFPEPAAQRRIREEPMVPEVPKPPHFGGIKPEDEIAINSFLDMIDAMKAEDLKENLKVILAGGRIGLSFVSVSYTHLTLPTIYSV